MRLTIFQRNWIQGFMEGNLIAYTGIILRYTREHSVTDTDVAEAIMMPLSFVNSVKSAYDSGITDPEDIVHQMDLDAEDIAEWKKASERRGIEAYIESTHKDKFGKLPEWVLEKIRAAPEEELQKWLDGSTDHTRLEEIFLGRDLCEQVLQLPPDIWDSHAFLKGMRRTLRIQLQEKFDDMPLWADEALHQKDHDQLVQLSRNVLRSSNLEELLLREDKMERQ
ncbi:hypothetical protein ECTPHS_14106 [Ectothiorhodospira sp. PHS-1]|uniref:hypothetical protein n=1 Tax=Ectothiorhodospira sp. PHS-1 TaxID=519989 RepID=UPI00024A817A|nr:hypothetical protein [Ectothiorhodospira sp. PHS-1]EHQ53796.1 hypothetical protein ECTPHS_14106 [Ectothiorhodospira sp. PHS-1]